MRIARYLANRSLWLDESMLTENILSYSFHDLLTRPLTDWQASPIGFLLVEKLAVTCLGSSEYSLRLFPLIGGLASLWFFAQLAQRWLAPVGAIFATLLFITTESLVYYSSEVKQYGMEVTVALALLWVATRLADSTGRQHLRWLITLIFAGIVGMLFSFSAIFILACLPLTDLRRWRAWTLAALIWLSVFSLDYFLYLKTLAHTDGLLRYWTPAFMPHNPIRAIAWFAWSLRDLFGNYESLWMFPPDVGWAIAAIGCYALYRRNPRLLTLLVAPILLAAAASATGRFPFNGRVVLFLMPLLIFLIGAGCQWIVESGSRPVAILAMIACVGPSVAIQLFQLIHPPGREEIKPMLAFIQSHRQPGDQLYCPRLTDIPFRYYAPRYDLTNLPRTIGWDDQDNPDFLRQDLSRLRGQGRVWVLITHDPLDEETNFSKILKAWGRCEDEAHARRAAVYLFDLPP